MSPDINIPNLFYPILFLPVQSSSVHLHLHDFGRLQQTNFTFDVNDLTISITIVDSSTLTRKECPCKGAIIQSPKAV